MYIYCKVFLDLAFVYISGIKAYKILFWQFLNMAQCRVESQEYNFTRFSNSQLYIFEYIDCTSFKDKKSLSNYRNKWIVIVLYDSFILLMYQIPDFFMFIIICLQVWHFPPSLFFFGSWWNLEGCISFVYLVLFVVILHSINNKE